MENEEEVSLFFSFSVSRRAVWCCLGSSFCVWESRCLLQGGIPAQCFPFPVLSFFFSLFVRIFEECDVWRGSERCGRRFCLFLRCSVCVQQTVLLLRPHCISRLLVHKGLRVCLLALAEV